MPYGPQTPIDGLLRLAVSIPHMGCMPYGPAILLCRMSATWEFQSLIWVACPTGVVGFRHDPYVRSCFNPSYGLHALRATMRRRHGLVKSCFNPSYGLHALRAHSPISKRRWFQSFNPSYGLHALRATACLDQRSASLKFQSLIWVACPTGALMSGRSADEVVVSIPHMGCMPYGPIMSPWCILDHHVFQSLIWVACPTGRMHQVDPSWSRSFNPSYGLHALRAVKISNLKFSSDCFNPSYGLHALRAINPTLFF